MFSNTRVGRGDIDDDSRTGKIGQPLEKKRAGKNAEIIVKTRQNSSKPPLTI
jgi:hypothetical protein